MQDNKLNEDSTTPSSEQLRLSAGYKGLYSGPDSSYKLAFADPDFLTSPEMRGVRMQLEISKPEIVFRNENIKHTITVFGSARFLPENEAKQLRAKAKTDEEIRHADKLVKNAIHYQKAYEFGRILGERNIKLPVEERLTLVTGGGNGIMGAASKGAFETGDRVAGFNISLPFEQEPNPYITPKLCFEFFYFASRKMGIVAAGSATEGHPIEKGTGLNKTQKTFKGGGSAAIVGFAGGYGTLDEVFELTTLSQVGKMRKRPIILVGKDYWNGFMNLQFLADEGAISQEDVDLITIVDTAEEAWEVIRAFYNL